MLAQAIDNPPTWFAIIIQAGSFGLLAYIVIFLAPQMFREARLERDSLDRRNEEFVKYLQAKFEERNNVLAEALHEVAESSRQQSDSWVEEIRRHTAAIKEATANICRFREGK